MLNQFLTIIQVASHCATDNFLEACINDKIKAIILSISDVLRNIADDASQMQMSLSSWWSSFNEKLKALGLIYQVFIYEFKIKCNIYILITFLALRKLHILEYSAIGTLLECSAPKQLYMCCWSIKIQYIFYIVV